MEKNTAILLLRKHAAGTLTEKEKNQLTTLISNKQNKKLIILSLEELLSQHVGNPGFDEKRFMPLLAGIFKSETVLDKEVTTSYESRTGQRGFPWKEILLVVIVLLTLATIAYFYYFNALPFLILD